MSCCYECNKNQPPFSPRDCGHMVCSYILCEHDARRIHTRCLHCDKDKQWCGLCCRRHGGVHQKTLPCGHRAIGSCVRETKCQSCENSKDCTALVKELDTWLDQTTRSITQMKQLVEETTDDLKVGEGGHLHPHGYTRDRLSCLRKLMEWNRHYRFSDWHKQLFEFLERYKVAPHFVGWEGLLPFGLPKYGLQPKHLQTFDQRSYLLVRKGLSTNHFTDGQHVYTLPLWEPYGGNSKLEFDERKVDAHLEQFGSHFFKFGQMQICIRRLKRFRRLPAVILPLIEQWLWDFVPIEGERDDRAGREERYRHRGGN